VPYFFEGLEDFARMVFEELDPNLWHYLWNEHKGTLDKFIWFLLTVHDIQCHTTMKECLCVGLDERFE
jgi:hypothetical protein